MTSEREFSWNWNTTIKLMSQATCWPSNCPRCVGRTGQADLLWNKSKKIHSVSASPRTAAWAKLKNFYCTWSLRKFFLTWFQATLMRSRKCWISWRRSKLSTFKTQYLKLMLRRDFHLRELKDWNEERIRRLKWGENCVILDDNRLGVTAPDLPTKHLQNFKNSTKLQSILILKHILFHMVIEFISWLE